MPPNLTWLVRIVIVNCSKMLVLLIRGIDEMKHLMLPITAVTIEKFEKDFKGSILAKAMITGDFK